MSCWKVFTRPKRRCRGPIPGVVCSEYAPELRAAPESTDEFAAQSGIAALRGQGDERERRDESARSEHGDDDPA